jgi:uncharacterized membrane protein
VKVIVKFWPNNLIKKPEKAFIFITLFFGILCLLITPPFQVADEFQHFYRAYQVSEGQFISEKRIINCYGREISTPATLCLGGMLPKSILTTVQNVSSVELRFYPERKQNIQEILALLNLPLNPKERIFIKFPNAALYSPVPYLPQALGMAFGRILGASPVILLYLGRLFNLLVWTGLIYGAIKIIPIYKRLLFLLALMPMSLFQAASLSADPLTTGLSFLTISWVLKWSNQAEKIITRLDILILSLLLILITLAKSAYLTLILLFFLIPKAKFKNIQHYLIAGSTVIILTVTTLFGWSQIMKQIYIPLKSVFANVSTERQVAYIFNHPFEYFLTHLNTLKTYGIPYLEQFIGRLGWLDTKLPAVHLIMYGILLLIVAFSSYRQDVKITSRQKLISLVILLSTTLLISTAMYVSWNPVGAGIIEGIQGRYFIAISPLFFLLFYHKSIKLPFQISQPILTYYTLFSCTLTLAVLLKRYYL